MKIAMTHVDLPNESKGGVAHQVHYLANTLVGRGHDVTVFASSPAYAECFYRVHQYHLPPRLRRVHSFLFAGHLARTDFSGFDILHTHGDNYLLRGRSPQLRTFYGSARDEAATAVTWRRRLYQSVMAYLEDAGARVADLNVGISEATRARLPLITAIVPCGVDVMKFQPGPKSEQPSVLFVGTAEGRKRGAFLADVFAREIRPHFPRAELWAVADRPLQGEGVVNYGRVSLDALTALYARAWVFCLPSTYEGFGVPYIEAMAAGTAVVASPNAGAREVLQDGRFGVLAEDSELGERLSHLLAYADQRDAFAARGPIRAQDFAWGRIAGQYEQLYADLMTGQAVTGGVTSI